MEKETKPKRKYTRKTKNTDFTVFLEDEELISNNKDIFEKYPKISEISSYELKKKIIDVLNGNINNF